MNLVAVDGSPSYIVAKHAEASLIWRVGDRGEEKKLVEAIEGNFEYINKIWASMTQQAQSNIFSVLAKIRNMIAEIPSVENLIMELTPAVAELMDLHDYEDIRRQVAYDPTVIVPDKCIVDYDPSDEKPGSRDQTYLRSDYLDLAALSVLLKPLIPIWTEFTHYTKNDTGKIYREYYAYMLLKDSYVPELPPIKKLIKYIACFLKKHESSLNVIVTGVGSEDYPQMLLSTVVVDKVSMVDIRKHDHGSNVITWIYYYVRQNAEGSNPNKFSNAVKAKNPEGGEADENKLSRLEGYKIKQPVSIGDISMLRTYMSDPYRIALKAKPDINLDLLNEFVGQSKSMRDSRIMPAQVALAQYCLKRVISPRGVNHLLKVQVINAIAVTQTILWEWGYHYLSGLAGATPIIEGDISFVGGSSSRARIPPELIEKIDLLYPIAKIDNTVMKSRQVNPVLKAIEQLNDGFSANDWELNLVGNKIKMLRGHEQITRISCPHEIKIMLARLIVDIAKI